MFHRNNPLRIIGILSSCAVFLISFRASAQSLEKNPYLRTLPVVFKMDLTQHVDPRDPQGLMATDQFAISGGSKDLVARYSSQGPTVLAGKQFQAVPVGYRFAELAAKRKWGSLHAFRSAGYDKRFVTAAAARTLAGGVMELPKSFLGTSLWASYIHGSPANSKSEIVPAGSQFDVNVARNLRKGFTLQSEFTRVRQPARLNQTTESGYGFFTRLDGKIAGTEIGVAYRSQGEDTINPAQPLQGQGRNLVLVDLRHTYKNQRLQYVSQKESLPEIRASRAPSTDVHQQTVRWTYAATRWPQLSVEGTWTAQNTGGRHEREETGRLSFNKSFSRLQLSGAYIRGHRVEAVRPLWHRFGYTADARLDVRRNRRLNFHYESNSMSFHSSSHVLRSEVFQFNTRLPFWKDRLAVLPVLDYLHLDDGKRRTISSSVLTFALSVATKLPRMLPGTDFVISYNARHAGALGRPSENSSGLIVQWNFRRS
jgi:hypothetical protein